MTNDERLDRLERILTLMVSAGRRTRAKLRKNIREEVRQVDEKIAILINAQIKTEDDFQKLRDDSKAMREESKAMRDDLYERFRDVFELFRLTDQKIARLTEVQTTMGQQLSALIERIGTQ